ncbi:hypothetical protein [Phytoactinopolyspora halotolerans]|uniref:Uncharacterized protein n=1 Tax=Phytoactinopolyspora halotolerans TaxID=1981512 RepID=A0A6L9SHF4_9ACTN|nr:hypothetical protein [Phytoactinopolyspora halotolerans]NEE04795.1 hypothetical protein [Phytoactinopolyspora halotolerans]
MRRAFADDAVVVMESGDAGAPGAAITEALCGHWDHEPPCPLAAHHVAAERRGDEVSLRVLFATEPTAEPEVRSRIVAALRKGSLTGPDGIVNRWRLLSIEPSTVGDDEADHAASLVGPPR